MRFLVFLLLFAVSCVNCKNHVKSLTESMGQEVIEIGSPIKDLPPGLDEEPSAEFEDDSRTAPPVSKRDNRKITTLTAATGQKLGTANERRSDNLSLEEEDRRIEKELSEIYKDNDYKSVETGKEVPSTTAEAKLTTEEKPVARQGKKPPAKVNFKFQPNINDRADVERFRTSVDDISCEKRVTQRLQDIQSVVDLDSEKKQLSDSQQLSQEAKQSSSSNRLLRSIIGMGLAILFTFVCQ